MLIEFRVANFRSIHEEQKLSLVASSSAELEGSNIASRADDVDRVLRSAVIYGPNASGKSNLLRAVQTLQQLVIGSAVGQEGQPLGVQPFLLQATSSREPTEFDIVFVADDDTRYEYFCAVTAERVHAEWMVAYPHGRPQRWFERKFDATNGKYEWWFGPSFRGDKAEKKVWQDFTRANALFFSTAVQLNNEQLRPAFKWVAEGLIVQAAGIDLNPFMSVELLKQDGGRRVMDFMRAADIGIDRMEIREEEVSFPVAVGPGQSAMFVHQLPAIPLQDWVPLPIPIPQTPFPAPQLLPPGIPISKPKRVRVMTWHKRTDAGDGVAFDLAEESNGTQTLFQFVGGWVRALDTGATLFIDELDKSLHPFITHFLVSLFHGKSNVKNAQLVFTTHDTSLLDKEIFRRDQVWFTEKDKEQATRLYSLLEYRPRKDEALERGYLKGRYGAVPFIGNIGV